MNQNKNPYGKWEQAEIDQCCYYNSKHLIKAGEYYIRWTNSYASLVLWCRECVRVYGALYQFGPYPGSEVIIESFGYKFGTPDKADVYLNRTYDVRRKVRNPWNVKGMRALTGKDDAVLKFVERCGGTKYFIKEIVKYAPYRMIYVGCHGGRHRSVAIAELAARALREKYPNNTVMVRHRELDKEGA